MINPELLTFYPIGTIDPLPIGPSPTGNSSRTVIFRFPRPRCFPTLPPTVERVCQGTAMLDLGAVTLESMWSFEKAIGCRKPNP